MVLLNIKVLICWYCKIFYFIFLKYLRQSTPGWRLSLFDTVRKILSSCGSPLAGNSPGADTHSAREQNMMQRRFCDFCLFVWWGGWWCSFVDFSFPQIPYSWLLSLSFGITTQVILSIIISKETSLPQLTACLLSCVLVILSLVFSTFCVVFQTIDHLCIILHSLLPSHLWSALESSA